MNKLLWVLIGMAFAIVSPHIGPSEASCTSPKFYVSSDFYPSTMCDLMNNRTDTTLMLFAIVLTPPSPPDAESTTVYRMQLKAWNESLFTKFDLRSSYDKNTRMTVPSDSELSWHYSFIFITKATALVMVDESYVHRLEFTRTPSVVEIFKNVPFTNPETDMPKQRFDVNGRKLGRKNLATHPRAFSTAKPK